MKSGIVHSANYVENVHFEYIKSTSCVRKNTNTASVYFETGGYQWKLFVFLEFLNFGLNSYEVKTVYGELYDNCERIRKRIKNWPWAPCIKNKLFYWFTGLEYIRNAQNKTNCLKYFSPD